MKNIKIAALLLTTIIVISSIIVIGYNQNWLQNSNSQQTPQNSDPQSTPQNSNFDLQADSNSTITSVSTMNLTLEIYGNANMDDKIDQDDITYLQRIINGTASSTLFADANHDGRIDTLDIDYIQAIINGNAPKLYLLDGNEQDISVSLPANRIIVEYNQNTELVRILEVEHLVVGIDSGVDPVKNMFFPNNADSITSVGGMSTPDYEAVLNLRPTTLLTFGPDTTEKASKLPGVDVVYLGLYKPNVTNPEDSRFIQGILKAGYIFNKVDRATEYANWILNLTSTINAKINTIPENQRQTVLLTNSPTLGSTRAYVALDTLGQACILAGGSNIANAFDSGTAYSVTIDTEYVLQQNPQYIFLHTVRYTYGGGTNEPAQGIDANDPTGMKNVLQEYVSQPAYADLSAVKNNNVYLIAGDFRNNAMGGTLGIVTK
jgi:iron complex transport system substrate-binding protein